MHLHIQEHDRQKCANDKIRQNITYIDNAESKLIYVYIYNSAIVKFLLCTIANTLLYILGL